MNTVALLLVLCSFQNTLTLRTVAAPGIPAQTSSFMVSEDYAQIDWKAVPGADSYQIQIRKEEDQRQLILDEKTVWTSFYFRVAQPQASYSFRLRAQAKGENSAWSPWIKMNTQSLISGAGF